MVVSEESRSRPLRREEVRTDRRWWGRCVCRVCKSLPFPVWRLEGLTRQGYRNKNPIFSGKGEDWVLGRLFIRESSLSIYLSKEYSVRELSFFENTDLGQNSKTYDVRGLQVRDTCEEVWSCDSGFFGEGGRLIWLEGRTGAGGGLIPSKNIVEPTTMTCKTSPQWGNYRLVGVQSLLVSIFPLTPLTPFDNWISPVRVHDRIGYFNVSHNLGF